MVDELSCGDVQAVYQDTTAAKGAAWATDEVVRGDCQFQVRGVALVEAHQVILTHLCFAYIIGIEHTFR